jgi:redox-sensitive bicupin YhaK (pirin superfamily)
MITALYKGGLYAAFSMGVANKIYASFFSNNFNKKNMATKIIHKANTRGYADHGWLKSYHSFSFANYYNPERMGFGALRVLNDDFVEAGYGFGKHPHDNMEIVSIPLGGAMEHADSMGNVQTLTYGEVQVMSAGTGIKHSEYNKSKTEDVLFLQIWVLPNKRNVVPRYDLWKYDLDTNKNKLVQLVSPNPDDEGVWVYQDAWFNLGLFDASQKFDYTLHKQNQGIYIFVLEGQIKVEDVILERRDAMGLTAFNSTTFESLAPNSKVLIIEIPML